MGTQPSTRQDTFGTEGIGEEGDAAMGTGGHSSQGGTGNTHTGGTQGNDAGAQSRSPKKDGPGETSADQPA